jgi:signal peptidase II
MRAWAAAGLVAGTVLAVDQVTKAVVRASLERGEDVDLVLGVSLTYVRNRGVAFGALSGGGTAVTIVVGLALVALAVYFATHLHRPWAWLPTGMLLGGAVGNLVDRLTLGAVTDFIDPPRWPAFNVADISITCGVVALLLVLARDDPGGRPEPGGPGDEPAASDHEDGGHGAPGRP